MSEDERDQWKSKELGSLSESEYKAWHELGVTLGRFSKAIQEMNTAFNDGFSSVFDLSMALMERPPLTRRERLAMWVQDNLYAVIDWITDKVKGAR